MPDDSIGDVPPIWLSPSQFPPRRLAKWAFVVSEQPAEPDAVVLVLVGRPDDDGNEPAAVMSLTVEQAELLADQMREMASRARRAR